LDTLLPPHSSRKEASISYRCTAVLGLTKDEWLAILQVTLSLDVVDDSLFGFAASRAR